jgi:hypothetical protein
MTHEHDWATPTATAVIRDDLANGPRLAAATQVFGPDAAATQLGAHHPEAATEDDALAAKEEDTPWRAQWVRIGDPRGGPAQANKERHKSRRVGKAH